MAETTLVSVQSRDLAAVGYDPETQTLRIKFLSGGLFDYYKVPPEVHAGLMAASSHGTYFSAHIKKQPYQFRKLL